MVQTLSFKNDRNWRLIWDTKKIIAISIFKCLNLYLESLLTKRLLQIRFDVDNVNLTSFPCDALISFSTSSTLSIVSTTMGFVALISIASETSMSPKTIGVKVLSSPASVKLSAISGLSMIAITFSLSSLSTISF